MLSFSNRAGMPVLVVEDDPAVAVTLAEVFEAKGHPVWCARTAAEAEALAEHADPYLVILDLILPDADGLVLCARLKARASVPIIVVSATRRRRDPVLALKLGADDFIAKPFDLDDLEARVEAVLRRAAPRHRAEPVSPPHYHHLGALTVDGTRRRVTLGGEAVTLTPTEYRLLFALAGRPNEVVSRQELAELALDRPNEAVGRAIDVHIRRLRAKLSAGVISPPPIVTVRGFGYKLIWERNDAAVLVA